MSTVAERPKVGRVVPNAPWPVVPLAEVTTKIGSGATPRGGESVYRETGIPLIRSMNVHFGGFRAEGLAHIDEAEAAKLNNVIVQAGDVLLNITGASIGRVTTAPNEMHGARVNQHVCIIRPNPEISSRFLALFFASPEQQARVMNVQVGATRQALTKAMIERWEIPLPPLPEQRRIVAEIEKQFTRLDTGVAALRRTQANLKRYRAAVLDAACDGRLVRTQSEWGQTTLGEISTVLAGYGFPERLQGRTKGDVGFFKVGDISEAWRRNEKILTQANHYISTADLAELRARLLPPGTVVFAKIGAAIALNRRAIIGEPSLVDNNVMGLLAGERIHPRYLFHFLCTQKLGELARSTTVPSIRKGDVEGIELKLPSLAEQARIVAEVERRLSVVEDLETVTTANLKRAARLRESILQRAFTGQLVAQDRSDEPVETLVKQINVLPQQAKAVKSRPKSKDQNTMTSKPVTTLHELLQHIDSMGGTATPVRLLAAAGLGEEIEKFFDLLREGRNNGALTVPIGTGGEIKRNSHEN